MHDLLVIMEIPFHMHKPAIFVINVSQLKCVYCTKLYAEKRTSKLNIYRI